MKAPGKNPPRSYEISPWEALHPLPGGWREEGGTFSSSCGKLSLHDVMYRRETIENPAALAIFHGFGEHGGRYRHFLPFMEEPIGVLSLMDHRGHGRSEGKRGHVARFDELVDDARLGLARLEKYLKKTPAGPEIHLLGHSMGGLITLALLMKYRDLPIRSVTLSAPLLGIALPVSMVKKMAALILSKLLGSLKMSSGLDITKLSHDRRIEESLRQDSLCHGKMTPSLFVELLGAMKRVKASREEVPYPVLFLVPLEDAIVNAAETEDFFGAFPCHQKKLVTYEHSYHEIFNEGEGLFDKETAFKEMHAWMRSHR
jgi:alpha-beta hydrolase superfamily lysophospholipase